ncbi:MAG: YafY family transcriptional regulator [Holophagales bacterium]|nr:YafY family transcriptional regulator [Holophagales bacterium]
MAHPTTRVLAVLELLQTHGRMTGPELARRIRVDVRTLRRYLVLLEEMGIPLTAERGRQGGYELVSGFKLPPMMFTSDEALALSVGLLAARGLGLAGAAPAVASAQAKLTRVLPAGLKRRLRAIDETVTLDLLRPISPEDNRALVDLTEAAQERRLVLLRYRVPTGRESARDFETYGVVYRGGCWYAVGLCRTSNQLRSFRLDRVVTVEPREERFARPADFDALAHLTRSIATLPRAHAVEVLLHAEPEAAQRAVFGALGTLEPVPRGVLLRSQVDDLGWLARELARLPFDFEVRSPAALRTALGSCARRLLRAACPTAKEGRAGSPARARGARAPAL